VSRFAAIATSVALIGALFIGTPAAVYAVADDIYVGSNDHVTGGSCADPDFSTDESDEENINTALDLALAEVDDDADTIIICDGVYTYAADISLHDGTAEGFHDVINIEIETAEDAEVTLDGNELYQLLAFENTSVSVSGIDFLDGQATVGGGAIAVEDGTLDVIDSTFTGNVAEPNEGANNGGAIWVVGSLTVNHSSFIDNSGDYGGAIFVNGTTHIDDQTIIADVLFDGNDADEGGAIWVDDSQLTVLRSFFTDNTVGSEGGAIYAYDSNWSVSHSTFGSASDDHDDPELNNSAEEGGDIHSSTGTVDAPVTGTITHSKFYDSDSIDGDGASLYMDCTALNLSNSLFHSTDSSEDAVIFLSDDDEGCTDYRATISRTTFTDNYASSDGVIYVDAGDDDEGVSGLLSLSVTNSLFSGNVAEEEEGVFDVEGPVDISIINSRFERNRTGDNGAIIEMDGGDDDSSTTNGSLTFSRNQVRFNTAGTESDDEDDNYAEGDGMIHLDDMHSWQIDYNTFQGNSADRGAVLAFEVDDDDLRDLIQLNGFRRNTIIGNSASVGGSYLFIQYNDNASNVNRASIKRIETQVKKSRNIIKGGTRPAVLQLLDLP
jgi:hypothetical protein